MNSLNLCHTCRHFVPDSIYGDIGHCRLFKSGRELEYSNVARLNHRMCNSTKYEAYSSSYEADFSSPFSSSLEF